MAKKQGKTPAFLKYASKLRVTAVGQQTCISSILTWELQHEQAKKESRTLNAFTVGQVQVNVLGTPVQVEGIAF